MPLIRVDVPFYLPKWLYQQIRRIKYALPNNNAHRLNLQGDRDVEWSFIAAHLPPGPGEALDFGCGGSYMSLIAARRGFHVLALDLEPQNFYWHHPNVRFLQGDLLRLDTPANSIHLVINCSSLEHVGLAGRFGVAQGSCDGDLQAMARLRSLLKQEGIMLLTIPCGRDHVFPPLHRVYGAKRLTPFAGGLCAGEGRLLGQG